MDMESKDGPSRGTFYNDFKWMTMAAADMQFLHDEIKWPSAEERANHSAFLRGKSESITSETILSDSETGMGDGNYRRPARSGDNVTQMCTPFANNGHLTTDQKNFNSRQRRFHVVIENTIGQIKKWEVVGGKAFRHEHDFEGTVLDVCAGLTASKMRVRDKYPRSSSWVGNQITDREAELGILLWMDAEDKGSHFIHDRAEDQIYDHGEHGDATVLQKR
eukprot:jgi/Undpi1/13570/HiC_scaffold_8.g03229.m1